MSKFKEKIISGTFWFGLTKVFGQSISWIITLILARLLVPADFGVMAMATVFLTLAEMVIRMGLGMAVIQKQDLDQKDLSSCFWYVTALGIFCCTITFFLSPVVAIFFNTAKLELIIKVLCFNLIISSLRMIPQSLLSKEILFKKRGLIDFFGGLAIGIVSIICAFLGFGIWSLIFGQMSGSIVQTTLSFYFYRWKPLFYISLIRLKKLLEFGGPWTISYMLWYVYASLDQVIVGRFFGDNILGFYRIAFVLSRAPLEKIWMVMNQVTFPSLAAVQEDNEKLKRYFLKITKIMALITIPACIGLIFVAEDFIVLALKPKWLPVLHPLQLLAISVPLVAIDLVIPSLVIARGKAMLDLRFNLLGALLFPVSYIIGIKWGINGICMAVVASSYLLFIYKLYHALIELKMPLFEYARNLKEPVLASTFMIFILFIARIYILDLPSQIARLIISIGVGVCTYLIFLTIISPGESRKDIVAVFNILVKKNNSLAKNARL